MEDIETENIDTSQGDVSLAETIFEIINTMFSNLFSSIDNGIYTLLNDIVFLDSSAVITDSIQNIFFSDKFNLLILANILVGCIFTYKIIKIVISLYTSQDTQFPYIYVIKSVTIIISMNCCLFICQQILEINYLITEYLLEARKLPF